MNILSHQQHIYIIIIILFPRVCVGRGVSSVEQILHHWKHLQQIGNLHLQAHKQNDSEILLVALACAVSCVC